MTGKELDKEKLVKFKTCYPMRATIMDMPDEELINELTRPITSVENRMDMDMKREALRRILIKLISLEEQVDKLNTEKEVIKQVGETYKNTPKGRSEIPEKPGKYSLKNKKGVVIHTGMTINLKRRVKEHHYDKLKHFTYITIIPTKI